MTHTDDNGDIAGMVDSSNSIWIDDNLVVKQPLLQELANNFFCSSRKVDFLNKNGFANHAIQDFVKEKTRGLIDQDFGLKKETVFALINTLYLKDAWNIFGEDLDFTEDTYTFNKGSDNAKVINLLQGHYTSGIAYEADTFTHYRAITANGYKLKFILPKDGHNVREVFTSQNIASVNAITDYNGKDCDNKKHYFTRCLFPEFNASYNDDLSSILQSEFGIIDLFDVNKCDFSSLTGQSAYCSGVVHATKLKVDKTGVEGAAVTIVANEGSSGPDGCEEVYMDFVLDRSFGFIITDRNDTILFTGVVENV